LASELKPARVAALGIAGIGRICLWQGGSLWIGRNAGRALPHAHHAIQITLALDGPDGRFLLRGGADGAWSRFGAAIVMPHRRHEFDGRGGTIAQIFVEPETDRGRSLLARFSGSDITPLAAEDLQLAVDLRPAWSGRSANDRALILAGQRFVDSLAGPICNRASPSRRIAAALDFISRRVTSGIALRDVAAAVHLSPSRLRHLFVQETGVTLRGYVLWLRILRAVAAMMDGRTWTDAAHEAGFADSAHLSRTFRRMFGVTPAMLIKE
jgi:AraC-like DNA-binding protein